MKTKLLGIFALSLVMLAVMVSGVSALSPFSYINQSQSLAFPNINITNVNSPLAADFGTFSIVQKDNHTLDIILTNISSNYNYYGSSKSVSFNITGKNQTDSNIVKTQTLNYFKSFCNYGDLNSSNLDMSVSVTNDGNLASEDSTTWYPLDTIEVEVTVSNNNAVSLNNMKLQLGLIDSKGNDIANSMDWISSDNNIASLGTISGYDSVTYTFKFTVDPQKIINEINSNGDSFKLMLKAYQGDQSQICVDHSSGFSSSFGPGNDYGSQIYINTLNSNNAVVMDMNSVPAITTSQCGQQVSFNPSFYNLAGKGTSYSKNQIFVTMYTPINGGIRQNQTIYGDLNPGYNTQLSSPLSFTVPRNADEKQYPVYFNVYYGYSDNANTGYYLNHYQYVSQSFVDYLTVSGGCVYATPATTSVQASLQSGGKAGQPLTIQATLANTGNKTVTYNLGLEGYTSWATLSSITPSNITLSPGQSQNVLINMNVNKDATSGDKQFYLDVYSNGYLITQQPLSLPVTADFWNTITGGSIGVQSAGLWAFNIILVIAIIVVLVLVLRKRK